MQEQISLTHIIQWILVVFAAGFIGYFGKHLGQTIITRIQEKKSAPNPPASIQTVESPPSQPFQDAQKVAKKLAKQELKQIKKGRVKPS